MKMSTRNISWG